MTRIVDKPNYDLPLLLPISDIESKEVLKACVLARIALTELNQVGKLLSNQSFSYFKVM